MRQFFVSVDGSNGRYWKPTYKDRVKATSMAIAVGKAARAAMNFWWSGSNGTRRQRITEMKVSVSAIKGSSIRIVDDEQ